MKHTMMLPLAALALTASLGACKKADEAAPAAAAADPAKVEAEVKAATKTVLDAFAARDAAKAVAIDAPDYVGMSPGMPNDIGPDGDLKSTKVYLADPAVKLAANDEKVAVSGDGTMAVETATYTLNFTDPKTKQVMTEQGNWLLVFRRQADGTMKLTHSFHAPTGAAK